MLSISRKDVDYRMRTLVPRWGRFGWEIMAKVRRRFTSSKYAIAAQLYLLLRHMKRIQGILFTRLVNMSLTVNGTAVKISACLFS